MNTKFTWGRVIQRHTIGPYEIIEYAERGADNHPTHPREETGRILFHWDHYSDTSLDGAIITAIAHTHDGLNTRARICLG